MACLTWAESVNRFFEPTVRIQSDRGHEVVDTGPYALIRHPGYASAGPLFIGLPLCLGSFWAAIPALLSCLLLAVRTVLEDRMLKRNFLVTRNTPSVFAIGSFPGCGDGGQDNDSMGDRE